MNIDKKIFYLSLDTSVKKLELLQTQRQNHYYLLILYLFLFYMICCLNWYKMKYNTSMFNYKTHKFQLNFQISIQSYLPYMSL